MAYPAGLDLQALAKLNDLDPSAAIGSRAIDTDGDGRPDLYLVDVDGDASVDAVVRAVDGDGDGINDTFVQFGEDGQVDSIGRLDPATGELEVIDDQPEALDEILGSLGLAELEPPEGALFTSFEDPYIMDTYGTFGDEVPATYPSAADDEPAEVTDLRVTDADGEEPPEVVPRIVEIEDRSGGDGSSLWAKVDENADGLADSEAKLDKTSTGTYYGDIDKDGYSENVASDLDLDGRIDTVDTTGQGSSTDTVGADQVVEPGTEGLVDRGDDDVEAVGSADHGGGSTSDPGGSDYEAGSSVDPDSGGTDSGGSSGGDDPA